MELDKIKQVKLSQVRVNKQNPRTIAKDKFQKLVTSILVFPKMLMIRPIVVDNVMQALGGNMRNNSEAHARRYSPAATRFGGLPAQDGGRKASPAPVVGRMARKADRLHHRRKRVVGR